MRQSWLMGILAAALILGGGFPAAWADKEGGEQDKAASGAHGKASGKGHGSGYAKGHGSMHGGHGYGRMGHHGSAGHFLRGLLKYGQGFGLTDEQTSKLKAIQLDLDRIRIKAEADIMIAEREAQALQEDEKSGLAAIEAKIKQAESMEVTLRMAAIKAKRDAQAVLTPEQREKVKAMHERMKMHGMMGRHGGYGKAGADGENGKDQEAEDEGEDEDKAKLAAAAKVTIDQAIKAASEKSSGTVIEAELEEEDGKVVWEVEIVGKDGKVTTLLVDAETGAVTVEEEDGKEKDGEGKAKKR